MTKSVTPIQQENFDDLLLKIAPELSARLREVINTPKNQTTWLPDYTRELCDLVLTVNGLVRDIKITRGLGYSGNEGEQS